MDSIRLLLISILFAWEAKSSAKLSKFHPRRRKLCVPVSWSQQTHRKGGLGKFLAILTSLVLLLVIQNSIIHLVSAIEIYLKQRLAGVPAMPSAGKRAQPLLLSRRRGGNFFGFWLVEKEQTSSDWSDACCTTFRGKGKKKQTLYFGVLQPCFFTCDGSCEDLCCC